jgi:3-hydroxyacyl-[acyl-carrier-protein] dehydratase
MIISTNEIYKISSFKSENDTIEAAVTFNEKHSIFTGHFPGNPIVPGVIQVQIIKDLMEKRLEQKLLLVQAKNIKFMNIISPLKNPGTEIKISFQKNDDQTYTVRASVYSESTTFMKFIGIYKPVNK